MCNVPANASLAFMVDTIRGICLLNCLIWERENIEILTGEFSIHGKFSACVDISLIHQHILCVYGYVYMNKCKVNSMCECVCGGLCVCTICLYLKLSQGPVAFPLRTHTSTQPLHLHSLFFTLLSNSHFTRHHFTHYHITFYFHSLSHPESVGSFALNTHFTLSFCSLFLYTL